MLLPVATNILTVIFLFRLFAITGDIEHLKKMFIYKLIANKNFLYQYHTKGRIVLKISTNLAMKIKRLGIIYMNLGIDCLLAMWNELSFKEDSNCSTILSFQFQKNNRPLF